MEYSKSFMENAKQQNLDEDEMQELWAYEQAIKKAYKTNAEIRALTAEASEKFFAKDSRVNIRLSSQELNAIKYRAMREGIPYQTLISSVLHKYITGQLHA